MKVKRNKRNRKFLQFYATSYGIKPPYKVVLDGLYLQAALEGKVKISEQIPKLLQAPGETSIMVTKCSIHDLKQKGDFYRGAVMIGSGLKYARCNHEGVIEPGQCLKLLIQGGNPDRLIMGAQEVGLRHFVRDTPGVPLLFIQGQVPILEPPAGSDKKHVLEERSARTHLSTEEQKQLDALKPPQPEKLHKRKKIKGPNPLSVKKKKTVAPLTKKVVSSNSPASSSQTLPASASSASQSVSVDTASIPSSAPSVLDLKARGAEESGSLKKKRVRQRKRTEAKTSGNLADTQTKLSPAEHSNLPAVSKSEPSIAELVGQKEETSSLKRPNESVSTQFEATTSNETSKSKRIRKRRKSNSHSASDVPLTT